MFQELPPFYLIKVWLDIQYQDTPQNVKAKHFMLAYLLLWIDRFSY